MTHNADIDAPVMCDCHNPPQRLAAHDDYAEIASRFVHQSEPLTADELAAALTAAPDDDFDWPYIDGHVIDGGLAQVCKWLVENYEIRTCPTSPELGKP